MAELNLEKLAAAAREMHQRTNRILPFSVTATVEASCIGETIRFSASTGDVCKSSGPNRYRSAHGNVLEEVVANLMGQIEIDGIEDEIRLHRIKDAAAKIGYKLTKKTRGED